MGIGAAQRRLAYGIVALLCLAWGALGAAGIFTAYTTPSGTDGTGGYLLLLALAGAGLVLVALSALVTGIHAIRRVDAGVWRSWRTLLVATGFLSLASACGGVAVIASLPVFGALLMLQSVALLGLAATLWSTPST